MTSILANQNEVTSHLRNPRVPRQSWWEKNTKFYRVFFPEALFPRHVLPVWFTGTCAYRHNTHNRIHTMIFLTENMIRIHFICQWYRCWINNIIQRITSCPWLAKNNYDLKIEETFNLLLCALRNMRMCSISIPRDSHNDLNETCPIDFHFSYRIIPY